MRKLLTVMAVVSFVAGAAILAVSLQRPESALAQETEERVFDEPLGGVLEELVQQGVIDQDQADKIAAAIEDRVFRFGRIIKATPHLETVAEVLGIDIDELARQLRDGATLAEIAGDRTQDVIDALVDEHSARIDRAVQEGRISEERAAEVRTAIAERIEAMVAGEGCRFHLDPGRLYGPRGFRGGLPFDTIAGVLGLTVEELREQLAAGSSVADIADEQGVSVEEIVDAVLSDLNQHLDDLVADQHLTEERANDIRAGLAESIESMLRSSMPAGGFRFDGGSGFPHFRGHGRGFPGPGHFYRESSATSA